MGSALAERLRHALARRFLLKIKRATHRANAQLIEPRAQRVLVVAPHMDDEVIPCGGTLLRLHAAGAQVHVVFVSDSASGLVDPEAARTLMRVRQAEAAQVRELMRFSEVTQLGFPDASLTAHEAAIADRLEALLTGFAPDLLLVPFPSDSHADHMACAASVALATRRSEWKGVILAYEVWTPLWPNVVVDISDVAEQKAEAIRLYASQVADRDYVSATLGLNRFRGLPHRVAFAEAFYRCDRGEFATLTAMLDDL